VIPDHKFRPEIVDRNTLLILDDSILIPIRMIGCDLDAKGILKEWDELESNGFPLSYVCRVLVAWEIKDRENGNFFLLPVPIHLIKILDSISCIKHIHGGSERINNLKKELRSLSSSSRKGTLEERRKANIQIPKTILSFCDEFQIGCISHHIYPSLRFSDSRGSDFSVEEIGIKVEAKSRLNRSHLGNLADPSISIDKATCIKLLSKDVFESRSLERAFEHQGTDIAVINMSHSQFGMLFAAHAFGLDNKDLGLSEALQLSLTLTRSGKKVVLLYSEQVSEQEPYSIYAIACDKQRVEYYGSRLGKVARDLNIAISTTEGYFRLIEEARKLN
jgi:hypothetical protein